MCDFNRIACLGFESAIEKTVSFIRHGSIRMTVSAIHKCSNICYGINCTGNSTCMSVILNNADTVVNYAITSYLLVYTLTIFSVIHKFTVHDSIEPPNVSHNSVFLQHWTTENGKVQGLSRRESRQMFLKSHRIIIVVDISDSSIWMTQLCLTIIQ